MVDRAQRRRRYLQLSRQRKFDGATLAGDVLVFLARFTFAVFTVKGKA